MQASKINLFILQILKMASLIIIEPSFCKHENHPFYFANFRMDFIILQASKSDPTFSEFQQRPHNFADFKIGLAWQT